MLHNLTRTLHILQFQLSPLPCNLVSSHCHFQHLLPQQKPQWLDIPVLVYPGGPGDWLLKQFLLQFHYYYYQRHTVKSYYLCHCCSRNMSTGHARKKVAPYKLLQIIHQRFKLTLQYFAGVLNIILTTCSCQVIFHYG